MLPQTASICRGENAICAAPAGGVKVNRASGAAGARFQSLNCARNCGPAIGVPIGDHHPARQRVLALRHPHLQVGLVPTQGQVITGHARNRRGLNVVGDPHLFRQALGQLARQHLGQGEAHAKVMDKIRDGLVHGARPSRRGIDVFLGVHYGNVFSVEEYRAL